MVVTGKLWHIKHNNPWPHHLKSSQRVSAASGLFPALSLLQNLKNAPDDFCAPA